MRRSILLLALSAAILGGCTSAYKTGQTPDDVYYSPERQHEEYVRIRDNDDRRYQGDDYYDDRYLRMKVHNRVMWSDLDDYYFYNPRYSYTYYNSLNWSNPWTPYTYWNYYYNPYFSHVVYTSTAKATYNHPRMFNLNTYNNNQLTNNNYTSPKASLYNNNYNSNSRPLRIVGPNTNSSYNNSYNRSSNAGNFLRNIFNGSGNSSSNNNSVPSSSTRSSSSNSNSSGSSGSSSGGTAPVRRF